MKRILSSALALAAVACMGVTPNAGPNARPILQRVNAVIAAIKADQPDALADLYASNAVIVDDQQPYEWTGAGAGSTWLSDVSRWTKWSPKMARFTGTVVDIVTDGSQSAYAVVGGTLKSVGAPHPWTQKGTLTFTLRNEGGTWKIASQTWTQNYRSPSAISARPAFSKTSSSSTSKSSSR